MSGVGCIILATQSLAVLGFEPVGSALVRCLAVRFSPSASELQPPQLATVMHVGSSLLSGVLEPQYLLRYLLFTPDQQVEHSAVTAASKILLVCCPA